MPYRSELIDDGTGVRRTGTGILTGEEMLAAARSPVSAFAPERITHIFVDYTDVTEFRVSRADLQLIISLNKGNINRMKTFFVAIVAPTDFALGFARMFELSTTGPSRLIRVFRSRADAQAWLASVAPPAGVPREGHA